MDVSLKRRARERAIAADVARELHRVLGPHAPEALAENSDVVCETFSRIFDQHGIVNGSAGARILSYVPAELARLNQSFDGRTAGSTDFNTAVTAGFYNTIDNLSVNAPTTGSFWYLQVDVDGDNPTTYIRQTATVLDTTAMTYIRTMINGSWGAWQPVVTLDPSGRLPPVDGSQLTNVNSGLSSKILNYISGLTLSTAGSTTLFSVAAGAANDSTNTTTMALTSALAKTTNSWSAGNGNGALDTGSVAINTWYHVFLIENATTPATDVLISLSMTPALPTGFTLYHYIGSMLTNGSGNWTPFVQVGDEFLWTSSVGDVSVVNLSVTATLFTLTVPTGVQVNALFRASIVSGTAGTNILIQSPDQAPEAVLSVPGNASLTATNTTTSNRMAMNVRTNTSAQIRAVADHASTTFQVATYGWIDRRGKS